jgi:hypothetical protein
MKLALQPRDGRLGVACCVAVLSIQRGDALAEFRRDTRGARLKLRDVRLGVTRGHSVKRFEALELRGVACLRGVRLRDLRA